MEKYLKCLHIHCNHVTDILIKCRQNHTPVALLKYKRMGQTGKSNGTRTSLHSAAAATQNIRCTPTGGITSWDRSHFDRMNL